MGDSCRNIAVFFIYQVYLNKFERVASGIGEESSSVNTARMPWISLVVLVVSILFALPGTWQFYAFILQNNPDEVRPSFATTVDVAKETMKGTCFWQRANRFSNEWQLHKPDALNNTIFWATDFNAGIALYPHLP